MPHILDALPEGYGPIHTVDIQQDKKLALGLNIAAILISLIMGTLMYQVLPFSALFTGGLFPGLLRCISILPAMVAYVCLHELVHGLTMRAFGCAKVRYGFTGMFAYAGCDGFFSKPSYIIIALSPVVFWGAVLALIQALVPEGWVWVVFFIQIMNISGAVGDFYVTASFLKLPREIRIRDTGMRMEVYASLR